MNQQNVSPCTIQSYKDIFRILLKYMHDECGTKATAINMETLNADTIIGFLNYLENNRKKINKKKKKCKTINNRLAAIKTFMEYVTYECL